MKGRLLLLQVATPVLAIFFGMLIASVMILAIGRNPIDVYAVMVRFSLTRTDSLFSILFKTTPLIFAGLAVAMSFRASLFNIGVEGQYYIGAFCAALVGFGLRGLPAVVHLLLPLGIAVAVVLAYFLSRTRFGYEVRAVAFNPLAAEAAGIPNARVQFGMFMLSAGIAGLVGLNDILGFFGYLDIDFPKGLGFLGISVALLAKNNPLGVIPAALLFGFLDRGAAGVQFFARVPKEIIVILQALIILAIVVAYELLTRYVRTQRKREAELPVTATPAAEATGRWRVGEMESWIQ